MGQAVFLADGLEVGCWGAGTASSSHGTPEGPGER